MMSLANVDVAQRQSPVDSAIFVHEHTHWLQSHGTTTGAFLSLLRSSFESTCLDWISNLTDSEKERLNAIRFGKSTTALVAFTDSFALANSQAAILASNDFLLFRQIAADCLLVQSVFDDPSCFLGRSGGWLAEDLLGTVIGDAILEACVTCKLSTYPGNSEARCWFDIPPEDVQFLSSADNPVTVNGLFEAVASINELEVLLDWRDRFGLSVSADAVASAISKVASDEYGAAFRAFLQINGLPDVETVCRMRDSQRTSVFLTFRAVADVALNPPLPPHVILPPKNRRSYSWSDIYPPSRFLRAAPLVKKLGLLTAKASDQTHATYSTALAMLNGWPAPADYVICHESREIPDFADESLSPHVLLDVEPIEFLLWCQKRLWGHRRESWSMVSNLDESRKLHAWTGIQFVPGAILPFGWFVPPLYVDQAGRFRHSLPRQQLHWFISRMSLRYCLRDIVCGVGPVELCGLPPGVAAAVPALVKPVFKDRFGFEVEFDHGRVGGAAAI